MTFGNKNKFKELREAEKKRREAEQNRRKLVARFANRKPPPVRSELTHAPESPKQPPEKKKLPPQPAVISRVKNSLIDLFRDDEVEPSVPSSALVGLADLYLHAAEHRTRHIALVWPATLKTLTLVHALATLVRWHEGDKQGVRGILFPIKANVFNLLNHIHFDRAEVLRIANELAEVQSYSNSRVKRSMPEKDAFFYSLSECSLPTLEGESFHPTIGELLPHFLATPDFTEWKSCSDRLLALIRAKLVKRTHAKSLKELHCVNIGDPMTAPDALFALDGRMSEEELRRAARALAKTTPPEVVLVPVTRTVRFEAPSWRGRIARFCMMLEEVFHAKPPGVVIVTDEPHAAYKLKSELWKRNDKREPDRRWRTPHEFKICGFPNTVASEGLLSAGTREVLHPMPREFNVYIVDADITKVANGLMRIANVTPGGREAAKPLADAASYLSRIAVLPCGVRHLSEYLAGADVAERTRVAFDWPTYIGAIYEFDRCVGVGENRPALMECVEKGSRLFENYYEATPFAHKLTELVANVVTGKRRAVAVVFTSALYRRLAERFLAEYDQYPAGTTFNTFSDRIYLITASHLEEHLSGLEGSTLVFAGLNENCLRLLLTDDRVPAHSVVLLTQRAGQFLRASLKPIVENFLEFKSFKPRIESLLRQLKDLPDDSSVLSTGDYVLPTFRVELSSDASSCSKGIDLDSWAIRLDNGVTQYRRDSSEVYVYDPASEYSSERGFRICQVKSLEVGDKLFVMSGELREMVEQALSDAGVFIQTDKTFEAALRSYHEQVQKRLAEWFPGRTLSEKARALRKEMLTIDPRLEESLPTEQAMRHWINLGESSNTPFEKLRPQAPQSEATFKAFAEALGFSSLEVAYQWQRVIMAVRNSRRLDGRHVSDIYSYMLLQPESAMANSNIKRQTLMQLFDKAREDVATVELVGPVKESKT
ncbi:hypothetical protein [Billgrantia aerodenitrificans]|uniref:DEAD/DEAH box helicase n=1 Tax=Billgrantia aerodenitrificans TaxID=2733483 RepID=A0ABS9AMA2_9GAMM|nr:hypothetical protein [Halomonas aerodenitrificans]MCE8022733.1 hypothetical protein [Halomonas aerodenitrificans]